MIRRPTSSTRTDTRFPDTTPCRSRDGGQVRLVETHARAAGLWSDTLQHAQYERVLRFDLSSVVRTLAGPSNPHRRLPVADLAGRGIAGPAESQDRKSTV